MPPPWDPTLCLPLPSLPPPLQSMVFFQKMGAMNSDVPVLGQEFNTWFPLTMVRAGQARGRA